MAGLFISHNSKDDAIVRELQQALALHDVTSWIDSRELTGRDLLDSAIREAIEESAAFAVLVSPDSLQSRWVGRELRHALQLQKQRGKRKFPVIPLALNGTRLGVLEELFDEEPLHISLSSTRGGITAALNDILVALGKRLPADVAPTPQPRAEPLEELVLTLTDLKFHVQEGMQRACGKARLTYQPATPGQREVVSQQAWQFIAPLGPIEAEALRWYLEKYAIWPSGVFRDRAARVEANLIDWGKLLHQAAMPEKHTAHVLQAWAGIDAHAGRRFSVHVDATCMADTLAAEELAAREAATLLLGLPWELLHDGDSFAFQGAKPTRVRRSLPNTRVLDVSVVATPIRVLLVSPRPEDASCGYIDHRSSALPLVEAMETLGHDIVRIHVLATPTLPALRQELDRARRERQPYHVIHFDGHGVYDHRIGLGGLCFEHPEDTAKIEARRHQVIYTDTLGPLLKDHRIPLVFLDACQSAQAIQALELVASEMLKMGAASVIAMSHSVLVATASRFVAVFYGALARGARVGDAMLEGQRQLKDNTFRRQILGAGELHLHDWFVPVLFQEKDDPQLFRTVPSRQTQQDLQTALKARLGEVPAAPATGFIGRSRDLLALQRLLHKERYAVLRGQGGEGKTTLAAEFARWMVRSQQVRRAAFVSVETHRTPQAVLDAVGQQLVPRYSVATFQSVDAAAQPVERALTEQSTLLVIDNMESLLPPPYLAEQSAALNEDAYEELIAILQLCARLNARGDTRIVFTSREALPEPFDAMLNQRELHRLNRDDAVELIEHILHGETNSQLTDAARESIEQLVDAVNGHARTLALLAPSLRSRGVDATRVSLVELMTQMHKKFPDNREQSLFASVELSLRRLSTENQERARVLGVFHGGVQLDMLRTMTKWQPQPIASLASELVETGLATPNRHHHYTLNPALCPYLHGILEPSQRQSLTESWTAAMLAYATFLSGQQTQNTEIASTLTLLELPNLFALLDCIERVGNVDAKIYLATMLHALLQKLGKPQLSARVVQVRDAATALLGENWGHARVQAELAHIEQQYGNGQLHAALERAQGLLQRCQSMGDQAYAGAAQDLAMAYVLLARVLKNAGAPEQALPHLAEARTRFEAVATDGSNRVAKRMVYACICEQGDCFAKLGRLDEAAAAYEESIRGAEQQADDRSVAVCKGQLGSVYHLQGRYTDALAASVEARDRFTRLDEPGCIATSWHQSGMAYQDLRQLEAAEDAYRQSLAIDVPLQNVAGQASTLGQLGILYGSFLDSHADAAAFYRQAVAKYVEIGDTAQEGSVRSHLADELRKLRRLDEARDEILRAIDCKRPFGNASAPWTTWSILSDIETDARRPTAAIEARRQAMSAYLAYRRSGGENQDGDGRLCLTVTQQLLIENTADASSLLEKLAASPDLPDWLPPLVIALQAITAGSRDRSLTENPELRYTSVVELLLLIEALETQGR